MKYNAITTPIYHKLDADAPWPEDKFFYLLAKEGLFKCRNHEFFQSCVPMKGEIKQLASQEKFLRCQYPRIPKVLLERAVGFFQLVVDKQNSESAVILAWNRQTQAMELIIPEQIGLNSSVGLHSTHGYPMDVKYEIPPLPPHLALIGDIHCHVDMSAYCSFTDEHDEVHRAGIHLIVGKIDQEPPEFYCAIVADGERFKVENLDRVIEGYDQRRTNEVPLDWLDKVKLEEKKWAIYGSGYSSGTSYTSGDSWMNPTKSDKKIIQEVLARFHKRKACPTKDEVGHELFIKTRHVSRYYCDERAEKFVKAWPKMDGHEETTQFNMDLGT